MTSIVTVWQDRTQNSKPHINTEFIDIDSGPAFGLMSWKVEEGKPCTGLNEK